ncbi:Aminopyrimidine aminohydrolase [Campylobacter majalis]|uniref:Aminopyrimidine aminohydrolase n=1 Tax=Campylobacter majalis TaxID=2790656 RepID=A0ABN7KBP5_9BACT|nr:thiaminase II [Campylobacter majalis]CAD7288818.1 Aminopyrimidine aminohydrolase [Campylobacter majalis]
MLFKRLVDDNAKIWNEYINHEFVKQIENGTLPSENFMFYLKQDYIYLINYAKCYARLSINARTNTELRFAMKFQNYIVEGEMQLHQEILKLGIDTENFSDFDESILNMAYSRYMLSVGESGDFLDMLIALAACAVGYGVIGKNIKQRLGKIPSSHPYKAWIDTYSSDEFLSEVDEFIAFVDSYSNVVNESKFSRLSEIFGNVTRLEVGFWQHGLEMKMQI